MVKNPESRDILNWCCTVGVSFLPIWPFFNINLHLPASYVFAKYEVDIFIFTTMTRFTTANSSEMDGQAKKHIYDNSNLILINNNMYTFHGVWSLLLGDKHILTTEYKFNIV